MKPSDFAITRANHYGKDQPECLTCYQLTPDRLWFTIFGFLVTNKLYDPKQTFIDLGAGYGCLIQFLKKSGTYSGVYGIEYDKMKVEAGNKKFKNLSLVQGDVSKYKDFLSDVIYTFNICDNKEHTFSNILQHMRKGQIFIESNDTRGEIKNMMAKYEFSHVFSVDYSITIGIK